MVLLDGTILNTDSWGKWDISLAHNFDPIDVDTI